MSDTTCPMFVDTHGYADDSQLYVIFRKTSYTTAVQHQVKSNKQWLCDMCDTSKYRNAKTKEEGE